MEKISQKLAVHKSGTKPDCVVSSTCYCVCTAQSEESRFVNVHW